MSSADVRSILDLAPDAARSLAPRRAGPSRKPDGISRELYALMGDSAPTLSASAPFVRDRVIKPVQWRQQSFGACRHWVELVSDPEDRKATYFRQFDRQHPSVMTFSQAEYDQHLKEDGWGREETLYLFDLLREYDLRFVVVADRYQYSHRSIEELKDRYYTVCRRLVRSRAAADPAAQAQLVQAYTFDKARETRRKQYASELFHLTAAEIAEEEALYVEIKRMEQNEKRYRADRDTLLRSVMGLESGLIDLSQANGEGVVGMDKKKRKRGEEPEVVEPPPPAPSEDHLDGPRCIRRIAMENTGRHTHVAAFLRSTKIAVPKASSAIRTTEILSEMGIGSKLVMPTRSNLDMFEQLVHTVSMLVDMKRQVDRADQEIRVLEAQARGFVPKQ